MIIPSFYPQTQQGADTLAKSLNAAVYMPDFFGAAGAAPFPLDKFPPSSDADKAAVGRLVNTAVHNAVMTNGHTLEEVQAPLSKPSPAPNPSSFTMFSMLRGIPSRPSRATSQFSCHTYAGPNLALSAGPFLVGLNFIVDSDHPALAV